MFGHVLSGESTPASLSFRFACLNCNSCKYYEERVGTHRTNLYDVLIKDLLKRKLITKTVLNLNDFNILVHIQIE